MRETIPGVYNNGYGEYRPQHVGMPEWRERHALRPEFDRLVVRRQQDDDIRFPSD